jgi:hypothetical protein
LVVDDADAISYVFPVTLCAFLVGHAAALVKFAPDDDPIGRVLQVGVVTFVLAYLAFLATVAVAADLTATHPRFPAHLQWLIALLAAALVWGAEAYRKTVSDA